MPRRDDIKKIMIIGSGPIVIGQACEFDYSGTQACKALRKLGYEIVLVNSNPATIMTDPGMADVTYIEPLTVQTLKEIVERERPDALLPNLGGQSGLNLSSELARAGVLEQYGVKVIGVNVDAIERGEDRIAFKDTMKRLGIEKVKPFFTKGVLIDMVAFKGAPMDGGQEISVDDIKGALKKQDMEEDDIGEGDVVAFHTGWVRYWITDNKTYNGAVPGIGIEAGKWLAEKGVAVVISDTWPVEVVPNPDSKQAFPVHQILLAQNGVFIHENAAT